MTDRITGIVLLLFAFLYGWGASRIRIGFGSDPLGPKAFPYMLAITLGIIAIFIILRTDPEPKWISARSWLNLIFVFISFIAYAYLLVPLGFILATTLETGFVGQRFGAKWWLALIVGLASSLIMYVLFVYALNLPLPIGKLFGAR